MERVTTALARRIENTDMFLRKALILVRPVIMALRLSKMAAKVLTLIPPAVLWDAPPIHISMRITTIVTLRNPAGLTDENPALRGTALLNTD